MNAWSAEGNLNNVKGWADCRMRNYTFEDVKDANFKMRYEKDLKDMLNNRIAGAEIEYVEMYGLPRYDE